MDINEIVKEVTKSVMEKTGVQAASGPRIVKAGYDASYGQYMDHTVLKPETTKATLKKILRRSKTVPLCFGLY